MRKYILLWALAYLGQDMFCNENLLSKFHQHGYKLKDVRLQLMSYNRDYINFFELKAFKYNRTTTAHNGTINMKFNATDKIETVVQAHKFLSNEYRRFPIRYQINIQKAFELNVIGLIAISKCGNLTSFCFYKDITYYGCNFVIDETHLPPLIPNGKYRMDLTMLFSNKEISLLYMYCEVYTPEVYPYERN